jgi:hypothetical protein
MRTRQNNALQTLRHVRLLTSCPNQETPAVSSPFQIGHQTVHNVRKRRQEVKRVHVFIGGPAVLNLLNVYRGH